MIEMNDAPVVQLTGVFRIVCSQPIADSSIFQTYLRDAQLDVFGKAWCNAEYSVFAREFGTEIGESFQTITYIVTIVSDIENVTVNEVDSRWKKFLKEVKSNVPFDKLDIRAKSILVSSSLRNEPDTMNTRNMFSNCGNLSELPDECFPVSPATIAVQKTNTKQKENQNGRIKTKDKEEHEEKRKGKCNRSRKGMRRLLR